MNEFEKWWHQEGSGIPIKDGEDTEGYIKRVAAIAWANGAYKEKYHHERR